jgi:Tol biopolymer transport system component
VSPIVASLLLLATSCESNKTTGVLDERPPARVDDLEVATFRGGGAQFLWTAPGDDGIEGIASRYEFRYARFPIADLTWEAATVIPSPPHPGSPQAAEVFVATGLPAGEWHFALRAADEVPNWSAISNVVTGTVVVPDTIAPSAANDLRTSDPGSARVTLSWTATGDDETSGRAASYDLRYALATISDETWDAAEQAEGEPVPGEPGSEESFTATDLASETTYFFALRVVDDWANASALSNVVWATTAVDTIPPGAVADLRATFETTRRVCLAWTAPGSDGSIGEPASAYDLRYATTPITEATWGEATTVSALPAPGPAGSEEFFVVTGLDPATDYSFALRTRDGAGYESDLSNVAAGPTGASPLRLTFSSGHGGRYPAWSPEDHAILYSAGTIGFEQIHELSFRTGRLQEMTEFYDGTLLGSAWSPDGTRIAFTGRGNDQVGALWVMRDVQYATAEPIVTAEGDNFISSPAWSPDGSHLAYTDAFIPPTASSIWVVPAAGGARRLLVEGQSTRNGGASWSPDGSRIAFSSNRTGKSKIWLIEASGGTPTQLTVDDAQDADPEWSPDGSHIAFTSDRSGNSDIWIMSSTGENPVQIVSNPAEDAGPSWSPDGREISFTSDRSGLEDIWVVAVP